MTQAPIRLDIFSDPVCPWCYVGKANLDRALAAHPDHPFQIQWHPFQLNPDMPAEGVAKRAYLEEKFGGKARVDAVHDRLREAATLAEQGAHPPFVEAECGDQQTVDQVRNPAGDAAGGPRADARLLLQSWQGITARFPASREDTKDSRTWQQRNPKKRP